MEANQEGPDTVCCGQCVHEHRQEHDGRKKEDEGYDKRLSKEGQDKVIIQARGRDLTGHLYCVTDHKNST